MAGTDLSRRAPVNVGLKCDVALLKVVLRDTLHLFKNVRDFEIGGCLRESALRDVVNLLKI